MSAPPPAIPPIAYQPLERLRVPRPVDRVPYVRDRCRGRRVLDLGAFDETEVARRQHPSWRWLHAEIASCAAEVLGVDASPSLPPEGITTAFGTRIVPGRVEDLGRLVEAFRPDLVVAGEIIEHTADTLGWLRRLAGLAPGTRFIATTPNATALVNIVLAFLGRENNHQDHLHVYSYKTLATLAARVPMRGVSLTPYYYDPQLFRGRLGRVAPLATLIDRAFVRPVQSAFPLTAFGWVLEGVLGP